jgi:hypothetical protein
MYQDPRAWGTRYCREGRSSRSVSFVIRDKSLFMINRALIQRVMIRFSWESVRGGWRAHHFANRVL